MIERPIYKPSGEWEYYDFLINKYYWVKHGIEKAESIRRQNLHDIHNTLEEQGVVFWLQGRTLSGLYRDGVLPDDHDDDIGIWIGQRETVLASVCRSLKKKGFTKIRDTEDIISFERDDRYIDICLFRRFTKAQLGYAHKRFAYNHFEKFDTLEWEGIRFRVPSETEALLRDMYPIESEVEISFAVKLKRSLRRILSLFLRVPRAIKRRITNHIGRHPDIVSAFSSVFSPTHDDKRRLLTEEEFLDINIEPEDSFNWKWRARHLDVVTDSGRYRNVRDIITYLSSVKVRVEIEKSLVETDLSKPFIVPANLDIDFWWGGNNYFWNCVKYGFRKDVVPYADANEYILNVGSPCLYTADYYESLEEMTDIEISQLFSNSPIELVGADVTSGKHRVFSMIGRMLTGRKYIPICAVYCD